MRSSLSLADYGLGHYTIVVTCAFAKKYSFSLFFTNKSLTLQLLPPLRWIFPNLVLVIYALIDRAQPLLSS
jgi:hypothetical protein